jgi:hypothetical protein
MISDYQYLMEIPEPAEFIVILFMMDFQVAAKATLFVDLLEDSRKPSWYVKSLFVQ